ncbi:MAG TPA: TlpA disulfide reductase family protein, partial [Bacteroidales bacterium]|nr:TlpA disulfide reductase family protein [Bacteroidales bacterium]
MKSKHHITFLFITIFSFDQTYAQRATRAEIDSLMCPSGHASVGQPYMEFKIENETSSIDNQALKGKIVFINFWFEGCHPCLAEMEALNELYKKMSGNKDFLFISLTWDNADAIKRVKDKFGLAFDAFSASRAECQRLNFGCGYPTSIILDKSGIVRYRHSG